MKTKKKKRKLQRYKQVDVDWQGFIEAKRANVDNYAELRNQIIEKYFFLLDSISKSMAKKFPPSVSADDCKQAGFFGLLAAVEAFEPSRNVNFVQYASIRIRGSILDYVRSLDPLSRQMRSKHNKFAKTIEELEVALGRAPSDEEIAEKLGISYRELVEYAHYADIATTVSLNDAYDDEANSGFELLDFLADKKTSEPAVILEEKEFFLDLMRGFNEIEILVMTLYYKDRLSLREIGAVLELSESRVSQIRAKALAKLNDMLSEIKTKLLS